MSVDEMYESLLPRLQGIPSCKETVWFATGAWNAGEPWIALQLLHAAALSGGLEGVDAEVKQLLAEDPGYAEIFIENWSDPPQYIRDAYIEAYDELPDWLIEKDKKRAAAKRA